MTTKLGTDRLRKLYTKYSIEKYLKFYKTDHKDKKHTRDNCKIKENRMAISGLNKNISVNKKWNSSARSAR